MFTNKNIFILLPLTLLFISIAAKGQVRDGSPSLVQQTQMLDLVKKMHQRYLDFDDPSQFKYLQISSADRFADGEELIFTMSVDGNLLAELIGIKHENGARFLISDFIEALDFPIKLEDNSYTGWFISQDNIFELQLATTNSPLKLVIDGQQLEIEKNKYLSLEDGIYINADELARWFGISLRFDFTELNVLLYPSTPLPLQQKLARQKQLIQDSLRNVTPILPRRSNDYQALSPQTIDATIGYKHTSTNDIVNYSILGARDFAFLRSEFYVSGNQDDWLNDGRVKFSKKSANNDLLGIGASQFEFGDITPVRTSAQTANLSTGVSVSNAGISQLDDINYTNFTGPVQTGWDVELYRNNVLLNAQYNIENGLYDFRDVPLVYGVNSFDVVFYGPQGQIEKKQFERTVDRTLQDSNGIYAASLNKVGDTLLSIRNPQQLDVDQGYLFSGSYRQNIAEKVSFRATTANQFGGDINLNTFSLGINARVFNAYLLGAEAVIDDADKQQFNTNLRTQFGKNTVSAQARLQRGLNANQDAVTGRDLRLTMSGQVEPMFDTPISYLNELRYNKGFDGLAKTVLRNNLGTNILGTRVNTGLTFTNTELNLQTDNTSSIESVSKHTFNLGLQRNFGRTFVRFQSNFMLNRALEPESLNLQLSRSFTDDLKARLTLSHAIEHKNDALDLNMRWRKNGFSVDSTFGYSEQTGLTAGLNMRFGIGYNPLSKSYLFKRSGFANNGTLVLNVFHDSNMNGRFDVGETPLPEVEVRAVQAFKKGYSDHQGMAVIDNLTDNFPTDIVLTRDSLPDPFMMPLKKGFSVTPRGGFIDTADIPIVYASEVEGSVFVYDQFGQQNTLSNITVTLYDQDGKKYESVVSEYDGYYLFTDVLPGNYEIEIEHEYLKANKLKPQPRQFVTLQQSGELSSGNDFTLHYQDVNLRYVVSLGEFASADVLNTFWAVLNKTFPSILRNVRPYIFRSENDQSNLLSIYFSQDQTKATSQCDVLFQYGIECEVITHRSYIE